MGFKAGQLEAHQKTASAQAREGNLSHPVFAILAEEPEISREDDLYWTAFLKLSKYRPVSMTGSARISLQNMRDYAKHYGFTFAETEVFTDIIEAMDDVYLKNRDDQFEQSKPNPSNRAVKPRS